MIKQSQTSTPSGEVHQFFFVGDHVRLAGQIDYPSSPPDEGGYPLIFIIQHATCNTRAGYAHVARLGNSMGMAVMRWDKRGTGYSGAGGRGSIEKDTVYAYRFALSQAHINRDRVVIFAQNEGSLILAENFDSFHQMQPLLGAIMAGNMADETQIIHVHCPLHIINSKNDWNAWQIYADMASKAICQPHLIMLPPIRTVV